MSAAIRCPKCGCGAWMHFADGCHTACGFICRCPVTSDDLRLGGDQ